VLLSLRRQRPSVLCSARTIHLPSPVLLLHSPAMTDHAPPATHEGFTHVQEGRATILFPKDHVFYNPVQQFNRDLSVAVIRTWSEAPPTKTQLRQAAYQQRQSENATTDQQQASTNEQQPVGEDNAKVQANDTARKITVLEALSASGLRAIRYALEIPKASTVYANDMSPSAIDAINRNIAHNQLPPSKMQVTCSDANAFMYSCQTKRVDVIDLDPYGTAAPFIDAAIQALASDGLLCVTCTDMSVLAGPGYPEKCFANYGGIPAKQEYTHEVVSSPNSEDGGLMWVGTEIGVEFNCDECGTVWASYRTTPMSFNRFLRSIVLKGCSIASAGQISPKVQSLQESLLTAVQ
jgi:hypothetical protein